MEIARREAEDLRHDHVGTEHLLLGILREGGGIATKLTQLLNIKINQIRKGVSMLNPGSPKAFVVGQLPFSERVRAALTTAEETAHRLGHEDVGIAHLFLGLTEDGQSKASLLLINLGLDVKETRREIMDKLSGQA